MNKEQAVALIWDYMQMHHELKKADAIVTLGTHDTRVAEYAAKVFLDGWAPLLVFSGSGTVHHKNKTHGDLYKKFEGKTEAEVFAEIALSVCVPKEKIVLETESQNTGQNYEYTRKILEERGIKLQSAIIVQKPYMERRAYATGKVWWHDVELIITSPPLPYEAYIKGDIAEEHVINTLVGDLQRIKEYPAKGFQIEQEIPTEVWDAFEYLVSLGYTKQLIKD